MKSVIKLFSILFLASGIVVFNACEKKTTNTGSDPNTGTTKVIDPPTKLSVSDITEISAKFTWSGTADSYEIVVGDKTFSQDSTVLFLSNLTEGTKYAWKVRAKKGSDFSVWVDGSEFTTKKLGDGEVSVYFGTEHWSTNSALAYTDGKDLSFFAYVTQNFPYLQFLGKLSGTTNYSDGDNSYYFEYYEKTTLYSVNGTDTSWFSDWWHKSGTLTITSNEGGKISGIANLVTFSAYQKYIGGSTNPEEKTLTVIFKNVNVQSSGAIQKSVQTKAKSLTNFKTTKATYSNIKFIKNK